jgi:hypothetical protein
MYILGIPQGWSLGRGLVFFLPSRMGGTIPSPAVHVTTYVAQTAYDSLGHDDAPSGVIDPLRTSPEILPGLLAYVSGMLVLPPQVGVLGGVWLSAPAAAPSGGVLGGVPVVSPFPDTGPPSSLLGTLLRPRISLRPPPRVSLPYTYISTKRLRCWHDEGR